MGRVPPVLDKVSKNNANITSSTWEQNSWHFQPFYSVWMKGIQNKKSWKLNVIHVSGLRQKEKLWKLFFSCPTYVDAPAGDLANRTCDHLYKCKVLLSIVDC
jgi:hypothetical protein